MPQIETDPASIADAATLVPDARRSGFLPRLFGKELIFVGEASVYNFMQWLSPDYRGGFWNFLEHRGKPLYLAPTSAERFRIICRTNDYEGEVSADAAGIIATLFTFSYLSFDHPVDHLSESFERLRDYACVHAEAAKILRAID
jgi:hypothetical protein